MAINGVGRFGVRSSVSTQTTPTYPIISTGLNWYYDISNPTCYPGSGTSITDLSGNGNTGTLVNGVGYSTSNGGILTLDGVDDYINVPHSTSLVKTNIGALFIWVKLNSSSNAALIAKGDIIYDRSAYGIYIYSNYETVEIASATSYVNAYTYPVVTGVWKQLGMVWNGTTIKKYINGVEVHSNTQTVNVNDIGQPMRIGARSNAVTFNANMSFGEVYLYDTLTPSQITANFNATKSRYGFVSYTTRTAAFAAATGITDTTILNALNTFDLGLISNGLDTKMKALYPFVGGTASTHKYNFMDARDLDAAFRITWFGGWTHTSKGIVGSGTNNYANTNLNALTHISASDNSFSIYKQNNSTINECYIRTSNPVNVIVGASQLFSYNSSTYILSSGTTERSVVGVSKGFYMVNRNLNNLALFKNTTKTSFTDVFTTQFNGNYIIGNATDANNYVTNNTLSFIHIGHQLSDGEQTIFYNLIQAMQTSLSRQV